MSDDPKDGNTCMVVAKLSSVVTREVEPVGRWFEAYHRRRLHQQSLSHTSGGLSVASSDGTSSGSESSLLDENDEDEHYLVSLDPTDWKKQDHYRVLGIGDLRHRATDKDIKRAYRRRVLRHHPDKSNTKGPQVNGNKEDKDYFSCITRAYDILGSKAKRRSYDSVDPLFDDEIPKAELGEDLRKNFLEIFRPVFERNARWSSKRGVPKLGNEDSTFQEVDAFYAFWYDFDSWREYSYLDEENKESGDCREERRWIEKQNKAARQKLKKEELSRIRELVDNAYANDPRIQRFRDEEKQKKLAQKKARQDAAKAKVEEEERIKREAAEAERQRKEQEEETAKVQRDKEKKERQQVKKQLQKERKTFRVTAKLQKLNERLVKEKADVLAVSQPSAAAASGGGSGGKNGGRWTDSDLQILIKAVNLFPAGTGSRWEVVANFINQHTESKTLKNAKDCIVKAKTLQKMDPSLKQEVNRKAFENFAKDQKVDSRIEEKSSEKLAAPVEVSAGGGEEPWSADEQKLLEQALKTFPPSLPDRWGDIANALPGRTKKECMKRYKDLVEMVKAKKAAQAAAAQRIKKKS